VLKHAATNTLSSGFFAAEHYQIGCVWLSTVNWEDRRAGLAGNNLKTAAFFDQARTSNPASMEK